MSGLKKNKLIRFAFSYEALIILRLKVKYNDSFTVCRFFILFYLYFQYTLGMFLPGNFWHAQQYGLYWSVEAAIHMCFVALFVVIPKIRETS